MERNILHAKAIKRLIFCIEFLADNFSFSFFFSVYFCNKICIKFFIKYFYILDLYFILRVKLLKYFVINLKLLSK